MFWEQLLNIGMGEAVTYTDVANAVGRPGAQRAVGSAVGRNPISFIVPCHRVMRRDGGLGGYHWGCDAQTGDYWLGGRAVGSFEKLELGY